jgi:hypothetical protein
MALSGDGDGLGSLRVSAIGDLLMSWTQGGPER